MAPFEQLAQTSIVAAPLADPQSIHFNPTGSTAKLGSIVLLTFGCYVATKGTASPRSIENKPAPPYSLEFAVITTAFTPPWFEHPDNKFAPPSSSEPAITADALAATIARITSHELQGCCSRSLGPTPPTAACIVSTCNELTSGWHVTKVERIRLCSAHPKLNTQLKQFKSIACPSSCRRVASEKPDTAVVPVGKPMARSRSSALGLTNCWSLSSHTRLDPPCR